MKQYTPEKLVAISRYQRYFSTLDKQTQADIYARMQTLIEEEKQWCDQGNYKHIAQILTTIALYEVLQQHGKSEQETYDIISTAMWGALTPKTYQKLARLSFFMPIFLRRASTWPLPLRPCISGRDWRSALRRLPKR